MDNFSITLTPLPNSWIRRHWLGVAFLMMTLLVTVLVDRQGRTIEQQQDLIRSLYADSEALAQMRAEEVVKQKETDAQVPVESQDEPKKESAKSSKLAKGKKALPPRDIAAEPKMRWLSNI